MSLFPFVVFDSMPLDQANEMLVAWGHKMGPLNRPDFGDFAHALIHEGRPMAVAMTSPLVRERVGGGLGHLTRDNAIELSRLCAARPGLCRVALRLWREFVLPTLANRVAISYQDADMHNGNTYRFDGWKRGPNLARSGGEDQRTGRKGRNRWIWVYPPEAVQ
jgi:hypothetical protein